MSASSHTRGHRYSPEETGVLLAWLEAHGRRVVNGTRALRLEVSKAAQYTALQNFGVTTPRTLAAVGRDAVIEAARQFGSGEVLLKPNRGGTGRGVQLFETSNELADFVMSPDFEEPLDGITLVQQYIRSPDQFIIRAEFIGERFFYAVRVDTGGSFELCPADPCALPEVPGKPHAIPQFTITNDVPLDLIGRFEGFLAANDIEVGAIEFVTSEDGKSFAYDVNTNTNYNSLAEAAAGKFGMQELARFLGTQLKTDQHSTLNVQHSTLNY